MAKIIIFGVQDFASLAHFYLTNDSEHEVACFSVHEKYRSGCNTFEGLPLIAFENIEERFPPEEFKFFAPMSHSRMNKAREAVFRQISAKGYDCISYISSRATIYHKEAIGPNCFILEDNTIQPFTTIGENVVLWSGNHIGHHSRICDHVFLTSHVVLSGHCTVEPFTFIGVNAAVRDGLRIREGSMIGMSACVTQDTQAWRIYTGIPARDVGSSIEEKG